LVGEEDCIERAALGGFCDVDETVDVGDRFLNRRMPPGRVVASGGEHVAVEVELGGHSVFFLRVRRPGRPCDLDTEKESRD
jgi:hypothetical protein